MEEQLIRIKQIHLFKENLPTLSLGLSRLLIRLALTLERGATIKSWLDRIRSNAFFIALNLQARPLSSYIARKVIDDSTLSDPAAVAN